jgi:NAD(P)-dependent dehydrogenase (short-subunit alcohol dehydrogenase family)
VQTGDRSGSRGRFLGKNVIVTGASSGIGRETAVLFGSEGAAVVVADIDEAGGKRTVELIQDAGGSASFVKTDVADSDSVAALVDTTVGRLGSLDILHNNAYWAPLNRPIADTSQDEWERAIGVTLGGVFLGCKFAIPVMIRQGHGIIVNTGSTAGVVASPKFGAYMAAKGGVLALTRSVAFDYGADGIRCNAVCPGLTETPATAPVLADDDRREWLLQRIVVGRIGHPSDIAAAVLFLASDESSFMTGQLLVIDGGRTIA